MTTQVHQTSSLLYRLLADTPIGELRNIRRQLQDEVKADDEALARKREELKELDAVIASRAGDRPRPVAKGKLKRNGARRRRGPAPGSLRQVILEIIAGEEQPISKEELFPRLESRNAAPGGENPMNTLGSRLNEMAKRGEIRKVGQKFTRNDEEVSAM